MKPITNFGLAVVLSSMFAASGLAAVGSEQARDVNAPIQPGTSSQTTTPWSPTMSSPNTPSHDGDSQLGNDQGGSRHEAPKSLQTPSTSSLGAVDTPKWKAETPQRSDPATTNAGCAGAC
jgi:hypothetical protein